VLSDGGGVRVPYGRPVSALRTLPQSPLSHTTVGDAMHRGVISCAPESRLAAVAAAMVSHAFHVAVILAPDGGRALVISDLDLIRAALGSDLDRTAAEIARQPMSTIGPSALLDDAVTLMAKRDVAHLLVAEPGAGWPAGVLSSFDVAAVLGGRNPALTRTIRPGPTRPLVSATALSATTVGAVMHPGVVARTPDTPLQELAGTMADLRMHCIAVAGVERREDGDEHVVWGLVSVMDVVHAAHRGAMTRPVSELAASAPLALRETAGLDRAASLMVDHEATHIIVVGLTGLPLGVVSTLDVLRILATG
jgi:predicted transcriptional regulator